MKKRQTAFSGYPQITIGKLIALLEAYGTTDEQGRRNRVKFDFGSAIPCSLASWRGDYSELQLEYVLTGYDSIKMHHNSAYVDDLITELKSAIGKLFTGWKGGDYKMSSDTPLWVSNSGNNSHTAIVGFQDGIILTAHCDYW